MTNFYASYLFLTIAVIFLIVGLYFKNHWWIFSLSGFAWLMEGIYCLTIAGATDDVIKYFGVFCGIAAIVSFAAPFIVNRKATPIKIDDTYESWEEKDLDGITSIHSKDKNRITL